MSAPQESPISPAAPGIEAPAAARPHARIEWRGGAGGAAHSSNAADSCQGTARRRTALIAP